MKQRGWTSCITYGIFLYLRFFLILFVDYTQASSLPRLLNVRVEGTESLPTVPF